jgi:hypothetical protein
MLIWILMSVGLVVIVAGGFAGRARRDRYRTPAANRGTHPATHHGKKERHSRGRGRH